jgi:hypothetical protein
MKDECLTHDPTSVAVLTDTGSATVPVPQSPASVELPLTLRYIDTIRNYSFSFASVSIEVVRS